MIGFVLGLAVGLLPAARYEALEGGRPAAAVPPGDERRDAVDHQEHALHRRVTQGVLNVKAGKQTLVCRDTMTVIWLPQYGPLATAGSRSAS